MLPSGVGDSVDVLEADLGERVDHPLRGLLALLGRVLLAGRRRT